MAAEDFPEQLRLVESFANSVDVEGGEDDLDSLDRFARWLAAHGFPAAAAAATTADLDLARALRSALRDEMLAHGGHEPEGDPEPSPAEGPAAADPRRRLDELAARIPLRAHFGAGPATLVPVGQGVPAVLGQVLAAVVVAERDGLWHRIKICREDTCRWVYFDRSKNASKTWCSMQVCGNRNKTRAYRGRRKPAE